MEASCAAVRSLGGLISGVGVEDVAVAGLDIAVVGLDGAEDVVVVGLDGVGAEDGISPTL